MVATSIQLFEYLFLQMYHRQVFKILLSNKVLEDPRQRRLFRTTDLTELFNLNEPINGENSESDQLFRDSKLSLKHPNLTASKVEAMKRLASELSKKIAENATKNKPAEKEINNEDITSKDKINDLIMKADENTNVPVNDPGDIERKSPTASKSEVAKCTKIAIEDEADKIKENDCNNAPSHEKESNKNVTSNETDSLRNTETNQTEIEDGEIFNESSNNSNDLPKDSEKEVKNKSHKSHRKHKKHKKKKSDKDTISALFEGERVSCLLGRRLGKSNESNPVNNSDDQYVLSKLFSKAGEYISI